MKRITVATALFLVAVSVSTVGITTTVGTEAVAAESSPAEIDSCTTINESGRYVITRDITPDFYNLTRSSPGCIDVTTSDVVIDGQGHTVLEDYEVVPVLVGVNDRRLSNVTVRNIDVGNLDVQTAIVYRGVDGGAVVNVTVAEASGVDLVNSNDIAVRESAFTDRSGFAATLDPVTFGVSLRNTSDVVIASNTFREFSTAAIHVGGSTNTTVVNNRVHGDAWSPREADIYGADPPANPLPGQGVMIQQATGTTVTNNTIQQFGVGVFFDDRNSIGDANATTLIANNTITANMVGVRINVAKRPMAVRHNDIVENDYGIYVPTIDNCIWDAAGLGNVGVHRNHIANNSEYGVLNERSFALNATSNYWGASSGPSSVADPDAPFADPVTDTLADGGGDAISEDPGDPGVSSVRFDSWLPESITNASVRA